MRRTRATFLRRLIFQVHLVTGLVVGLYIAMMGITGSILVFRPELQAGRIPAQWRALRSSSPASASTVVARVNAAYPGARIVSLEAPTPVNPMFVATLEGRRRATVACDPSTGDVLGPMPRPAGWLTFVTRLHETLLLSGGTGRRWNGVGAAFLLLLAATGLVNWWPRARTWRRAITVGFRFGWRRINFDLHRAAGFWALLFVVFWASTGIYFAWTSQLFAVVNAWSPIVSARPPSVVVTGSGEVLPHDLDSLVARASLVDPGTTWSGVFFPYGRRAPFEIIMRRAGGQGREYEDTVYFDPYTGEHLATWRYGVNESLGDWFIWLQIPLHFGTSWGLAGQVIWAVAGLVLPLLAITGAIMYWNRILRHRLKRWH